MNAQPVSGWSPEAGGELVVRELRGLQTGWWEWAAPGKPILFFLHGYPDTPASWSEQIAFFRGHYHLICPFTRGLGPSERSRQRDRYGDQAVALDLLQIHRAVDPAGERPVILVGHDLGAVAAWNLGYLLENRLQALVILNGFSLLQMFRRVGDWRQHLRSWYIYGFQLPWLPDWMTSRFPRTLLRLAHNLGGLPPGARPELPTEAMTPIETYRALARRVPDLRRQAARVLHRPVLVIWGEKDRFLMPPRQEELSPFASRVVIRILEGNHWIHRERAKEVNEWIAGFLKETGP